MCVCVRVRMCVSVCVGGGGGGAREIARGSRFQTDGSSEPFQMQSLIECA